MPKEPTEKSRGKYFTRATKATEQLCEELVIKYHDDLDTTGAKIDIVMAFRDPDGEEPAMMVRGHRILGKAKVLSLKERVMGRGDAEITLDGDAWEDLSKEKKAALLDHELEHFEVKRDKMDELLYDDINRPIIKLREHDREFGWFDTVAQRHRSESMEIHQLEKLFVEAGQVYLPFIAAEDGPVAALAKDDETTISVSVDGKPAQDMTRSELLNRIRDKMKGGAA